MQRSYKARKSCLETAGSGLACAPPWTMQAKEDACLGRGVLPGREGVLAPNLRARPATPLEGEAGGRGGTLLRRPYTPAVNPRRGGGGEEGVCSGGGDDRLVFWLTLLLPPPPQGGGGALSQEGARVCLLARRGEVRTPRWLPAQLDHLNHVQTHFNPARLISPVRSSQSCQIHSNTKDLLHPKLNALQHSRDSLQLSFTHSNTVDFH
jgi:hypothetical protein